MIEVDFALSLDKWKKTRDLIEGHEEENETSFVETEWQGSTHSLFQQGGCSLRYKLSVILIKHVAEASVGMYARMYVYEFKWTRALNRKM